MEVTKGKTRLMVAAQTAGQHAQSTVTALLSISGLYSPKAEINHRDHKGRTALMLAARCGSDLVVQLLVEAGADLEVLCDRSETACAKAQAGGHVTSALLLMEAGARHGQSLGTTADELWTSAPPTACTMPSVSCCELSRFGSQFRNHMPLNMPGLVAGWPASQAWTHDRERLAHLLGGASRMVPVLRASGGFGGRAVPAEVWAPVDGASLSVGDCLARALNNERCDAPPMMSKLPLTRELLTDLGSVPRGLFGGPSVGQRDETNLWVSSAGSVSPLQQFDHCHSVICQFVGRKRVTCFAPRDGARLYPFSQDGNVRTSRVDLWTWRFGTVDARGAERRAYPDVACAVPLETVLSPGDVCYIPPGWWHHVETLEGGSVSVLLPFDLSASEQRTMDRPWTQPGWGEPTEMPPAPLDMPRASSVHSSGESPSVQSARPSPAVEPPGTGALAAARATLPPTDEGGHLSASARPICVNPQQLAGFLQRVGRGTRLQAGADWSTDPGACAPERALEHERDWCDAACAQIRQYRFALLRLPPYYADMYQQLLQPSLYPPAVTEPARMRSLEVTELPTHLVELARTWGYACETICGEVTRHLLALGSARANDVPEAAVCGSHGRIGTLHGLLRISFSSSAHAHHAHYDGSYTTLLGPGNTAGCLQFANSPADGRSGDESESFLPSEHFLPRGEGGVLDRATFFVFTGVKHGGICDPCKPLRHRVVPPNVAPPTHPMEGCDGHGAVRGEPASGHVPAERINVIYFLNSYYAAEDPEESRAGSIDGAAQSDARLEINSFGQERIVHKNAFLCWPPWRGEVAEDGLLETDAQTSWTALVDAWDEGQAIDWSGDGL